MDKMTLREYRIRKKAHQLELDDKEYDRRWRAWLNWNVQGTKKQGKNMIVPIYRTFKDFYDYEKGLKDKPIVEDDPRKRRMKEAARKRAERRENNGDI